MGRKFTIFALFYFVFEGKFQVQALRGAYIRRGNLTEGFLPHDFGGLIFGGAFTSRGLFSEFYGTSKCDDGYIFVKRGRLIDRKLVPYVIPVSNRKKIQ